MAQNGVSCEDHGAGRDWVAHRGGGGQKLQRVDRECFWKTDTWTTVKEMGGLRQGGWQRDRGPYPVAGCAATLTDRKRVEAGLVFPTDEVVSR